MNARRALRRSVAAALVVGGVVTAALAPATRTACAGDAPRAASPTVDEWLDDLEAGRDPDGAVRALLGRPDETIAAVARRLDGPTMPRIEALLLAWRGAGRSLEPWMAALARHLASRDARASELARAVLATELWAGRGSAEVASRWLATAPTVRDRRVGLACVARRGAAFRALEPVVRPLLDDPDEPVQAAAAAALVAVGAPCDEAIAARLLAAARSSDRAERDGAVRSLGRARPVLPAVVTALAERATLPSAPDREAAATALAEASAGSADARRRLVALVGHPSLDVRASATRAAGALAAASPDVLAAVADRLLDDDDRVATIAAAALERCGDACAPPPATLVAALRRGRPVNALLTRRLEACADALIEALATTDGAQGPLLSSTVLHVLPRATLAAHDATVLARCVPLATARDTSPDARATAVAVVARAAAGGGPNAPALVAALARVATTRVARPTTAAGGDGPPSGALLVAQTLGRVRDTAPVAWRVVAAVLDDGAAAEADRAAAARALVLVAGWASPPDDATRPWILRALSDRSEAVRAEAAAAVRTHPAGLALLLDRAEHGDVATQRAALAVLPGASTWPDEGRGEVARLLRLVAPSNPPTVRVLAACALLGLWRRDPTRGADVPLDVDASALVAALVAGLDEPAPTVHVALAGLVGLAPYAGDARASVVRCLERGPSDVATTARWALDELDAATAGLR